MARCHIALLQLPAAQERQRRGTLMSLHGILTSHSGGRPIFLVQPIESDSMFTRILVPTDGSDFSDSVLPFAAVLARRSDAALELVHVHRYFPYSQGAPAHDRGLDNDEKARTHHRIANTQARLAAYLGRDVSVTWLEGPPAHTLGEYVSKSGADLVVMTTHGRGGLSRVWLGSVADHMVRHSPVPVLLVRPTEAGVAWLEEPVLRRIVIPLDGSELAESILERAVMLATPGETELALLQVVVPLMVASYPDLPSGIAFDRGDLERRQRAAERYLERLADELRANGFATTVIVAVDSHIARAILDYAEDADADLIALATHARGAPARFVLGSVADKVLRAATMPLLMFRPAPNDITRLAETRAQVSRTIPASGASRSTSARTS